VEFKVSPELVSILYALLPGFTAAWVFYAYTAHKKPSPFERTVQALIFTGLTIPFSSGAHWLLVRAGDRYGAIGDWTPNVSLGVGMLIGILVGLAASWLANTNYLNRCCSWLGITKKTSYSSEWYGVFHNAKHSFVYLTFEDERRIFGWAEQYPDDCQEGHFVLTEVAWINEGAFDRRPLVERMLIPAKLVEFVEFEKPQTIHIGRWRRFWRFLKRIYDHGVNRIFAWTAGEKSNDRPESELNGADRHDDQAQPGRPDPIRLQLSATRANDRDGHETGSAGLATAPATPATVTNDGQQTDAKRQEPG
jgi:hypothetical protein